jgi:magnesium chelatase family protein
LDRIDIHIEVPAVPYQELQGIVQSESSKEMNLRVSKAREIQSQRFSSNRVYCNAHMSNRHIRKHCKIDLPASSLMETAIDRLGLSARAYTRILKIARTIADIEGKHDILLPHVAEAIQYRSLDRGKCVL